MLDTPTLDSSMSPVFRFFLPPAVLYDLVLSIPPNTLVTVPPVSVYRIYVIS